MGNFLVAGHGLLASNFYIILLTFTAKQNAPSWTSKKKSLLDSLLNGTVFSVCVLTYDFDRSLQSDMINISILVLQAFHETDTH
jgi:hypothetical protein